MDSAISKTSSSTISVLNQSFAWMFAGLMLTAATSFVVSSNKALTDLLISNGLIYFGLFIAEFAVVVYLSFRIMKMSFAQALGAFLVYAVLNGVTLTAILLAYTATSIAGVFVCTAAIFGVMAAIGYTTKKDLTSIGMLCFVGLIGVIIASVVNLFLRSDTFSYVLSYLVILVFLGLTAYDTQKLKKLSASGISGNLGILGALTLYLDFINIFINLLRIFGKRS